MGSTLAPSAEIGPQDGPANDAATTAADENKADNDIAAPRFPKALKAKKKQKKLAAKLDQDPKQPEDGKQQVRVSTQPEDGEQDALEFQSAEVIEQSAQKPKSPRDEEATSRGEKKPKNRRKREAREAGNLPDRKKEERVRRKADDETREAQDPDQPDGGKREAREAKKSDETTQEPPPKKENWQLQKAALKEKFPEGWSPRKRLSPDALAGIRALHQQFPEEYTTEVLANKFEVSAEAIRRILKSKWEPQPEEEIERQERWFNRGKRIWSAWAEEGKKPPTKWRKEGITRDPSYHEQRRARSNAQRKLAKTLM
ncbi:hypothetical protein BR93DRAFT_968659 [Coniochaeta sp. PMI_546]|nr:hypothetical protein BR93DRAFT_968659 [Coniochaeta sp. PMI_546]